MIDDSKVTKDDANGLQPADLRILAGQLTQREIPRPFFPAPRLRNAC
jgi:hypothetical protein